MAIGSNDNIQFNLTNITDNQILVYDAVTGSFKNETSAVQANTSVTGLGRNIGSQGVGLYKQNDSQYLEFYKLQSGANTTISLNDNVIFIDAVVGSGTVSLGSANANTIAVFDANGNVLNGSDNLLYDGTTLTFVGANNNVSMSNGTVTANNLVTTNFSIAGGNVTFPTADGTASQILQTDGAGNLTFVNNTDITSKLDSVTFNAHVAQAMVTTGNNAPALNDLYSLGNSSNKFSQVFSTYFRGTADVAVNAQNLGSIPAANFALSNAVYSTAQVDALIANVDTANVSGLLANVRVTNGSTSYVQEDGNVDIRGDGNITVTPDTTNKRITIGLDASQVVTRAFKVISDGSSTIAADSPTDTLTITGGSGINVVASDPDTLTITNTGITSALNDLSDVSTAGASSGQVLKYNGSSWAPSSDLTGGGGGGISLTDLSVTTDSPSGNGSLSYNNSSGVFTFAPANVQTVTQSLSWNSGNKQLTISGGNTVDLSVLMDNTDAQDITISGNVISLTGQTGNVDLTSLLGSVAGNYGDSNVASYLTTNNYAQDSDITTANTNLKAYVDNANTNMQTYVNTANTNVVAYVDNQVTLLKGGANVNLDSLAEVANALNNSNTQLSTVAFTGNHTDVQNRPTIALSGSDLTYDGTTLDLSGLGATGPQGPQGNAGTNGTDGVSVSSGTISGNSLVLTMSDSSTINVTGNVVGPTGSTGAAGSNGTDGVGITSVSLVGGANLVLNYSNSSTQDVGNIKGPQGATGSTGAQGAGLNDVSVTTLDPSGNGSLSYNSGTGVLTFTPANTSVNTDAQDLTISGNVISLSGQSGNVDLTSILGSTDIVSDTTPQLGGSLDVNGQDITSASNGNIELSPHGTGRVIFKGQSGNGGNGAGRFQLNCENNSHGIVIQGPPHSAGANYVLTLPDNDGNADQVLKTDGSGALSWVDQSGGGSGDITDVVAGTGLSGGASSGSATVNLADTSVTAGTYGSATKSVQLTIDAQGRITSAANVNISGGGGGGSGTSYEYFKLYYTSAGAIDTTQGSGGYSDKSTNIGNVTINNAASNSCEVIVDFGGNYNYPPLAITAYGFSQSTSEYLIKGQSASTNNTTLKLAGGGSPHGTLGSANLTLSLTRSETGSSSGFGQSSHAWIYFTMGS